MHYMYYMLQYADVCNQRNIQIYAIENMHKIKTNAQNMQKYAAPHDYASNVKICKNMQEICNYMQKMPAFKSRRRFR